MLEVRVAKKLLVCNALDCGKVIEKGERYYWNKLMRRARCMGHQPPESGVRRRENG
jgi:hypothetical protein